jgi:hypothetical protein
MLVGRRPDNFE